jgi:hypothetical protein
MTDEEQYLRQLGYPVDEWILDTGQQWFRAVEVGEGLGLSHDVITKLAEGGAFPGAVLHDTKRVGWRIPREGVIHYLYEQRKRTEERQEERKGTA